MKKASVFCFIVMLVCVFVATFLTSSCSETPTQKEKYKTTGVLMFDSVNQTKVVGYDWSWVDTTAGIAKFPLGVDVLAYHGVLRFDDYELDRIKYMLIAFQEHFHVKITGTPQYYDLKTSYQPMVMLTYEPEINPLAVRLDSIQKQNAAILDALATLRSQNAALHKDVAAMRKQLEEKK